MALKQAAAALLILSAACSNPATDIQALLAEPEIDVRRLEEIFAVEPGDLRLDAPELESIGFAAPLDPWVLANVGKRPVWLLKADLRIKLEFVPFLPPDERYGGRLGGRVNAPPSRPVFRPEEWTCLQPGSSLSLDAPPPPEKPGIYTYDFNLPRSGEDLCWKARSFIAGQHLARPESSRIPLLAARRQKLVLPARTTPGAPWHEQYPIDIQRTNDRRFFLSTTLDEAQETPGYLELEAFVLDDAGRVTYRGPLRGVRQSTTLTILGELRVDSTYELAEPLPPGRYRILVRAAHAEAWFLSGPTRYRHSCDAPPGAHSAWVQFSEP